MSNLINNLFELSDESYKEFHKKLIPTVPEEFIIGIRTPVLRKFAADFSKTEDAKEFIKTLPHKYYEENNLHAFLIEKIRSFDDAVFETEKFLPYIDNWATSDMFCPPVFKKNPDKILPYAKKWIKSDKTYTIRYGIKIFMDIFSDRNYKKEYMQELSEIKSDEYYVNMMISWYFATLLAKQYKDAEEYIRLKKLPLFVHNKSIQKAAESYRIDKETKEYLKTLKIKGR